MEAESYIAFSVLIFAVMILIFVLVDLKPFHKLNKDFDRTFEEAERKEND